MNQEPKWEKEFDESFACKCGGDFCGNVLSENCVDDLKDFIRENFIPKEEVREWCESRLKANIPENTDFGEGYKGGISSTVEMIIEHFNLGISSTVEMIIEHFNLNKE